MDDTPGAASLEPAGDTAEECPVCLEKIAEKTTLRCGHFFCSRCVKMVFAIRPACPVCNAYHGQYIGTQPDGVMKVCRHWQSLQGFEGSTTIVIQYLFPSGTQGPQHPNPGAKYSGTCRTAFLPATKEGEKVLKLLRKAFERRLIFTVGQSTTTGMNNVITWNDIHHKTRMDGGPQNFGFPDPDYLYRVQEELRLKGVTEADIA